MNLIILLFIYLIIMNVGEQQYLNLLEDILKNGVRKVDQGTTDVSYSVFGRQIRFDLNQGFPLLTTKKIYWKGVLHELYWFLSGQSNIKYLVDNNVHIWDDYPFRRYQFTKPHSAKASRGKEEFIERIKTSGKFAEKWGNLPRIYGELWRRWPTSAKATVGKPTRTIDQLSWAIKEVIQDPACHNAIVTSWNPEYLYTMAAYKDTSHFPICHNMYQLNVNDGRLSLQLYQRSADIFLGVPFNIASYALLALIIAKVTGYKPGEFIHTFGDVHIYNNHFDQVHEQLARKPKKLPTMKIIPYVKDIFSYKYEDFELVGYDPYPPIKAQIAI